MTKYILPTGLTVYPVKILSTNLTGQIDHGNPVALNRTFIGIPLELTDVPNELAGVQYWRAVNKVNMNRIESRWMYMPLPVQRYDMVMDVTYIGFLFDARRAVKPV